MVSLAVARLLISPPVDPDPRWLFGLIGLVIVAQVTALLAFQNIDLSVASAVSLAALPLFGPLTAALVAAIGELASWAIRQYRGRATLRERGWVLVFRPLGFNIGMVAISLFVAGRVFNLLEGMFGANFWAMSITWLVTAVVSSQVNMWLLIFLLKLLTGAPLTATWNEHRWVVPIDVLVPAVGGGVIAQAVEVGNFLAVLIFFLPIILSAFALHLYAQGMEKQKAILEQKVAERTAELESTNQNLLRVSEEKDEFLAILTHDMRTPLTSIKGYTSILRDRELPKSQQNHIAKIVLRAGDNLLELVNNILDIENIRGGGVLQIVREPLNLSQVAQNVTEDLLATAAEKQIEMVCDAPHPLTISADSSIIRRVVTNLVSNALKYSPDRQRGPVARLHLLEDLG
ncbi:MAG: sensor histidine kinase, partial [Anaerolineae bacterium]